MAPRADRLGDVVAQACLSIARMVRVVEKTHNSKTTEALIVKQHLEKVSVEAIDSTMDEIQGACTPADIWQVEKKILACVSHKKAKAYGALVKHHNSVSDHLTGKDGLGGGSSKIVDAEEDFCKSISTVVSTMITEGAKIPGECGAALTSSILHLVPTLPLDPGTSTKHRFITGEGVQDHPRQCLMGLSCESEHCEFPPQFIFNWRSKCPHGCWEIHHQIWSGHDPAHHIYATSYGLSFLQETCKHQCPHTPKRVGDPKCMQLSFIEGTPYVTSGYSRSY